jgi:hypothetical protein
MEVINVLSPEPTDARSPPRQYSGLQRESAVGKHLTEGVGRMDVKRARTYLRARVWPAAAVPSSSRVTERRAREARVGRS